MIMCDDYKVLTITHPDVENGTGCRVTIWASGCPHHCPGCHNKHTWEYGQGKNIFDVQEQIFEAVINHI
jgi:anaerobic ribonucleoside-triphosphate reductase activating protein